MNPKVNQLLLPLVGIRQQLKNTYKFGFKNRISVLRKSSKKYKYTLVLSAIVKNEDEYLLEWVSYHKVIGVDHIILYDNSDQSKISEILRKFVDLNFVEIIPFSGKARQLEAYMDSVSRFREVTQWLVTLDLDEFLTPLQFDNIKEFLNKIPFRTSQVLISWLIFGSNGHLRKSKHLVLERFTKHASVAERWDYKPIVRPDRVVTIKIPHYFEVVGRTTDENGKRFFVYPYVTNNLSPINDPKRVRVNHYYTKSKEEFDTKKSKGFADQTVFSNIVRNNNDFMKQDRNELSDEQMKKWIPSVRQVMEEFRATD